MRTLFLILVAFSILLAVSGLSSLQSDIGDYNYPKPDAIPHGGQTILTVESPSCPTCGYPDCGCVNLTLQPTPVVNALNTPVFEGLGDLPTALVYGTTVNIMTVIPDAVQPVPPESVPQATPIPNASSVVLPTLKPNNPLPVYTLVP